MGFKLICIGLTTTLALNRLNADASFVGVAIMAIGSVFLVLDK